MHIEVHIEEFALHGFASGERYRIAASMERELVRLLAEQGPPALLGGNLELTQVDAGAFDMQPNAKAETIGVQVAQAIYRGMSR
jgi:hypothetical protein